MITMGHSEERQHPPDVLRAKHFAVVTNSGEVRARFGLKSGEHPSLELFAPGGGQRLSLDLDFLGEPVISLRDAKENTRTFWGDVGSDTPTVEDDNWALSFQLTGEDDTVAEFGMVKRAVKQRAVNRGIAVVRDVRGHWSALGPE